MKIKNNLDYMSYKRKKKRNNKRRLAFIFFSTFVVVVLFFSWLASALTPTIDIPVLNNDESVETLTSNDFKGRVDSRLKLIELQDKNPSAYINNSTPALSNENNIFKNKAPKEENKGPDIDLDAPSANDSHKFSIDEANNNNEDFAENKKETKKPPKAPMITRKPAEPPKAPGILLRKKITTQPQTIKMSKVIVGKYASPQEARDASETITNANANLMPFIREINGSYSLQVGSFSNSERAKEIVEQLKQQNYSAKVIQE